MTTADQIIDAALTAFYQNGFHASGVDQLSAAAGVTKRTLYRHFQSKESLIEAVLQWRDQQFMQDMQAEVEAEAPARRPLAYLEFLQRWGQRSQGMGDRTPAVKGFSVSRAANLNNLPADPRAPAPSPRRPVRVGGSTAWAFGGQCGL